MPYNHQLLDDLRRRTIRPRAARAVAVHPEPQHVLAHPHALPQQHEPGREPERRAQHERMRRVDRHRAAAQDPQRLVAHDALVERRARRGRPVCERQRQVQLEQRVPHRDLVLPIRVRGVHREAGEFIHSRRDARAVAVQPDRPGRLVVDTLPPAPLRDGLEEHDELAHVVDEVREVYARREALHRRGHGRG